MTAKSRFLSRVIAAAAIFAAFIGAGESSDPAVFSAERKTQQKKQSRESTRDSIVRSALSLVGSPYKYGGSTAKGFDCCGFVMYVYGLNNIRLPRTSREQYAAGRKIDPEKIKKGDLLFYHLQSEAISHVGIYIGDQRFVHAPVPGTTVRVERIDMEYWTTHFAGAATFLE